MKVRFWGVRGSTPTPAPENLRYGGNTPCVEVRTPSGKILIFDAGTGFRLLGKQLLAEFGHKSIQAHILLSHYHWDHIQGIPFFEPLYNPENHFHFHSFESHWGSVQRLSRAKMSDPYFPVQMSIMKARRHFHKIASESFNIEDTAIRTLPLNHPQGCLGFRIECGGYVLVYATDNEPGSTLYDRNVRELAQGADMFIYDSQYTPYEYSNFKRGWGHSTWREGVTIAEHSKARQLILFHHDPDHTDVFLDSVVEEAKRFFPNVVAAWEGLEIDFSAGEHLRPPQDQSDRRLGHRQPVRVPLRVRGRRPDGSPFQEDTLLENLSVRGAFFFLDTEPDTNEPLQIEVQGAADFPGKPGDIIQSRVVRNQEVSVDEKTKRGIGVSFSI